MWGSLIDYWYYSGDTTYNDIISQAILFQTGPQNDFLTPNQTRSTGNDDQAFWAITAMSAAELKFPNPPSTSPQWLALAQAVFNEQASRWDTRQCGGGLRWQIQNFNTGYEYRNSVANGCFFNLASRLGAYTQNATYFDWADKTWNWMEAIGLISPRFNVFDGSDDRINCTRIDQTQWSYNVGSLLLGAATMWNQTSSDPNAQALWAERTSGLINASALFFHQPGNIMFEIECEPTSVCNNDQFSFKAYLSRWMAATTKVAPWTAAQILPFLSNSAQAAAKQCSGGSDGVTCGTKWWTDAGVWDGTYGVGQQMSALEVIQSLLIGGVAGPVGNSTGGTSQGDPSAGTGSGAEEGIGAAWHGPITTKDKVGAWVLTAVVIVGWIGVAWVSECG